MQVLEKILAFEEKAESFIVEAKKEASKILQNQEEEIKKIYKDHEIKLKTEQDTLKESLQKSLEKKGKDEQAKREEALKIIKTQFEKNINQAIKLVKEDILSKS